MDTNRDIVVLSGVRTAIGRYGGGFKDVPLGELAAAVVRESVKRSGLEPKDIGHCVFGNIIHTDVKDMYLSRVAALQGGLPKECPAFNVNRLCGSGLQAIISAAQAIKMGDCDAAVGGGAENMSRAMYFLPAMRWGQRMSDTTVVDAMTGALTDPFENVHMGLTVEYIARKCKISREEQDEFAADSHRKASAAIRNCIFKEQILPFEVKSRSGSTIVDTDEHVRADATVESLAKMKPAFDRGGSITAGNASGLNDAASAVVVADRSFAEQRGLTPKARLVAWSFAGVEPKEMGLGPIPAVKAVLAKTGLKIEALDVIEANEAFAAQAVAVAKALHFPAERTNPNGGAVALGHPIGATGNLLVVKLVHELHRIGGRYGLVTMCIGGGQGIAAIFEKE